MKNLMCCTPFSSSLLLVSCVYFYTICCPNYCLTHTINQNSVSIENLPINSNALNSQINSINLDGINSVSGGCNTDRLAVYKVVLHTYWTRDLFPKHYPDWRPPAQWTKTFGRSHDASFNLFHIGKTASSGVKAFVETGRSDQLDNQVSHDGGSIFDEFTVPAIASGSGRSETKFFVDGNHTIVSLMTRIVPSPDWFIGVDSLQLCIGGSWIETVTVEMDPLDAGTDNGFTFTAPNWPTEPQGIIYRITSRYPAHPAGSFFYPQSKRLPPIATFQFIKLKEYELSEVFHYAEDDRKYDTVDTKSHLDRELNQVELNNELSATIEQERQHEMTPKPLSITEKDRIRAKLLAKMNATVSSQQSPIDRQFDRNGSLTVTIPKNNKMALLSNIAQTYATKRRRVHSSRKIRPPKDCRVGHWSEWSDCSKMCGIGEMHRYRKVIKHAKRGGRHCPPLKESKWCGSARDCKQSSDYFKW